MLAIDIFQGFLLGALGDLGGSFRFMATLQLSLVLFQLQLNKPTFPQFSLCLVFGILCCECLPLILSRTTNADA